MLQKILRLLEFCWALLRIFLTSYWHWVINNPTHGLVVSGIATVVFGIICEIARKASQRPILRTYKTGRKEIVEEFGHHYIEDEEGIVQGKATFGKRLSGYIGCVFQILAFIAGCFAIAALISLIFS